MSLPEQLEERAERPPKPYSLHAGQVTVADGSKEMGERIQRVLTNDPGIGVARHVDAGYPEAIDFANKSGVKIPMP